jgi:hypothetical protein
MEGLLSVKCLKVRLRTRKVLYDGEIWKEVTWASTVRKVGSMDGETLSYRRIDCVVSKLRMQSHHTDALFSSNAGFLVCSHGTKSRPPLEG